MDYIYAKLDNGLVNVNQIEYIELKRCGREGFPLKQLKIGDFYLETKIIKSGLLTYTDMSSLNEEDTIIKNKLEEEIKNRIEALNQEEARTNAMINQLNENVHSQFVSLNKILIDAINTINGGIEEERQIRAENDQDIREALANETARTNSMINQVNENIGFIVNELNSNIISIVNTINESLRQEAETRALEDTDIRQNLSQEIQDREEAIANEQDLREKEDIAINKRIDDLTIHTDTSIENLDNKLTTALNEEIANRKEAITTLDDKLTNAINEEIKNRETAVSDLDKKLTDALNEEIGNREQSISDLDSRLTKALNDEEAARIDADNTLTQNLNKEIEDRTQAINDEKKARENADKVLTDNLNKEIQDRKDAITQLDNSFTQKLNEEITNRENAVTNLDNKLTTALNKEIEDRKTAVSDLDTKLTKALSDETEARKAADNALTERVTNEVSTLNSTISSLDTRLTNAITTETNNRIEDVNNARQEATNKIEAEKQARESADNNLTQALEKEKADRTSADNDLSRRVDNLEGKTTRLFYGEGTLTSPNATQIQSFIDGLNVNPPYTAPYSGIAIVVHITQDNTYHIWHYYDNLKAWRDDGIDTVSTFTNTTKGIIQGSDKVGYISAVDGVGKVNGWEELTGKVDKEITDRQSAINTLSQNLTNAINEEARVRQEQDTSLTQKINKEVSDRQAADTNLTNTELRYTKSTGTTIAVGGIPKGTTFNNKKLIDIINQMLYPYVAFSISGFTLSPNNGGTFEKGSSITLSNSTVNVSLGSENITKVEVFDGSTKLGEKTSGLTGSSFQVPINLTINANKTLKAQVTDNNGTVLSRNSPAFNFVYPFYYGSMAKGDLNPDTIKSKTKVVQAKGNKSFTFSHSDQCCMIAYPSSYGKLKTIIDQNNFDVTKSFTENTINITGLDGTAVSYYVYVNSPATLNNFKITFNF